jgi:hypothetical protein
MNVLSVQTRLNLTKQIYAAKVPKPEPASQRDSGNGNKIHRVHRSAPDFVFRTMKSVDSDKVVSIIINSAVLNNNGTFATLIRSVFIVLLFFQCYPSFFTRFSSNLGTFISHLSVFISLFFKLGMHVHRSTCTYRK